MAFDIHQLDELDDFDEEVFYPYHDELLELFHASPEGQAFEQTHPSMGFWAHALIEYGYNYTGATLTVMDAGHVDELLTDIFPRKVSLSAPEDADDALPELIAFWEYLRREYKLANADEVLDSLRALKPAQFRAWMNDSSRFGMAKSFFAMGQQGGFDMSTEEGNAAFMQQYNANLARPTTTPSMLDLLSAGLQQSALDGLGLEPVGRNKKDAAKAKHLRKIARASRKKNRKRK